MKSEEIELLRKRYYEMLLQKKKLMMMKKEILLLRESQEVKRYLELVGEYQEIKDEGIADIENMDDNFFIKRALNFSKITPTNNIYVYMGAYKYNQEVDYLVGRDDDTANYFVYYNLEGRGRKPVIVSCSEVDEFEKKNHIIVPKNIFDQNCYFSHLQEEYFKTVILASEEKALLKVRKYFKENQK